ncbi:MAG: histone deacetylase family protein [Candidatus Heimdallarchaeaceae archaeon]
MDKVVVYTSDYMKKHKMDALHPERPERIDYILEGVNKVKTQYPEKVKIREITPINEKELYSVHVPDLINTIKSISAAGGGMITLDTMLNEETFNCALYAAGGAKQAAFSTYLEPSTVTFAVVRPPGHHAETNSAGGFCFFNNIAIAAEQLIRQKHIKRVAIIDLDQHFGNGTSHIFYHRSDVLYTSIHAHPKYCYPFSGYPSEIGIKEGAGYTINVPLLPGTETIDWLHALNFVNKIVREFSPEIILVSIGFDGLKDDPVGMLNLSLEAFHGAAYLISELARDTCKGKITAVLEGGYYLQRLSKCAELFIRGLLNERPEILNTLSKIPPSKHATALINQTKKAIKEKWRI